jgi:predicted ATPase
MMPQENINLQLDQFEQSYYKLYIVVGEPGSGKSKLMKELAYKYGSDVLNLNLLLSELLLPLSKNARQIDIKQCLQQILSNQPQEIVFLDSTEVLFDTQLRVSPLKLLKDLSRNRKLVATWSGSFQDGQLVYAKLGHPEYRIETDIGLPIIDLNKYTKNN